MTIDDNVLKKIEDLNKELSSKVSPVDRLKDKNFIYSMIEKYGQDIEMMTSSAIEIIKRIASSDGVANHLLLKSIIATTFAEGYKKALEELKK